MLGRQAVELSHARQAVDALVSRVTELSDQLRHLQAVESNTTQTVPQQMTSHKPRINNPPVYAGEPTNCRSFLIQCEVVFSLQPQTYASDKSKVAYVISLQPGRARDWGAAIWDSCSLCCEDFKLFKAEMIKVFDRSVFGKEASRQLAALRQGKRSIADYAIEFKILAATSDWNPAALAARFWMD
ncbi:Retrotransposon-derived protein PEG10 [Labeo rohita]|uniref:Retrotransposon-derived protein PEG10 n=1 Tax=Labeo rohita TaxID=84645 RepID=A0ABQ8M2U6_LABRO|nr:Retrotransposon-derived protein PEG10 [Labeo rohita]